MYKAIPRNADWIRDNVLSVEPEQNLVITAFGQKVSQIWGASRAGISSDLIKPRRWL